MFAERFRGVKGHPYEQGFDLRFVPQKLGEPFRWRTPKMIFVNSMSDLFHEGIPDSYIEAVASVMVKANWHTYQVLTKRPERMRKLLNGSLRDAAAEKHIWWGVSVEDKKYGVPRIVELQATSAAVRFLSVARYNGQHNSHLTKRGGSAFQPHQSVGRRHIPAGRIL